MGTPIEFSPPYKGYNDSWPYCHEADKTTSLMQNIRIGDSSGRYRLTQRPGLIDIGGSVSSTVQCIESGDVGFGSAGFYDGDFSDGALSGNDNWNAANAALVQVAGMINNSNCGTTSFSPASSGVYKAFEDTFHTYTLLSEVDWNTGACAYFQFVVNGNSLTIQVTSNEVRNDGALMGWETNIQFSLYGATTKYTIKQYGLMEVPSAGRIKLVGDATTLRFFWNDSEILNVARTASLGNTAAFALARRNNSTFLTDAEIIARIKSWSISVVKNGEAITHQLAIVSGGVLYLNGSQKTGFAAGSNKIISGCFVNGNFIACSGATVRLYDSVSEASKELTASKGAFDPTSTLCCNYRNRLVLAGSSKDPYNWYMSRQDNIKDWNYGAGDAQTAVAGNMSENGKVSDPITALIPYSEGMLIIGTTNSIWKMSGDPAAGGVLTCITRGVGILTMKSWAIDAQGTLWFLGNNGLYKYSGGAVENVSMGRVNKLSNIIAQDNYCTLIYDANHHGLVISIKSIAGSTTFADFFYDMKLDAFFKDLYPVKLICGHYFVSTGTAGADTGLYIGSANKCYNFSWTQATDESSDIVSYCMVGAQAPAGPTNTCILGRLIVEFASGSVDMTVYRSTTLLNLNAKATGDIIKTKTLSNATRYSWTDRIRGTCFGIYFASKPSATFVVEQINGVIESAQDLKGGEY